VQAAQFINHVYVKIGDIDRFAAWNAGQFSRAIAWGFPEERVAVLTQVIAEMQQVYADAGSPLVLFQLLSQTRGSAL
jgi:hypothetical protein